MQRTLAVAYLGEPEWIRIWICCRNVSRPRISKPPARFDKRIPGHISNRFQLRPLGDYTEWKWATNFSTLDIKGHFSMALILLLRRLWPSKLHRSALLKKMHIQPKLLQKLDMNSRTFFVWENWQRCAFSCRTCEVH